MSSTRTEHDSLGSIEIPADAPWGAQTQRAIENFPISGQPMPAAFIRALAHVKSAAAQANVRHGSLERPISDAICAVADAIADGEHADAFPVDIYQTGSGTSTNMNANEVIATLASKRLGGTVHPNDHVNMSQSSNDVIPTATHLAVAMQLHGRLIPAVTALETTIRRKGRELRGQTKTGRTHLMDAMPVRFDQALGGWAAQLASARGALEQSLASVSRLAIGATAVGTGINAHPKFGEAVVRVLRRRVRLSLAVAPDPFEALSSMSALVQVSGATRQLAVALMKIANDLRWMNSGPLAGLGEIELPALQPGSSIMPGKVNPVIPESVCMVAARVIGNDVTTGVAAQSGNFELNVMWPVAAATVLESVELLANSCTGLGERAVEGFAVRPDVIAGALSRNPILVTALNAEIGYERGAAIAKRAYAEGRPVIDVAAEDTDLPREQLEKLLDPSRLAGRT